jgi:hypothetical protein
MAFDRYWPAVTAGGRNYAQGRSTRVRRLLLLPLLLGPLIPAIYAAVRESTRMTGFIVIAVIVAIGVAVLFAAFAAPAAPSGVYEVDDEGEPLEYLGTRLPLELRRKRGVTYEAFIATVRARSPRP